MADCKCEHWQTCPSCMPHLFDENGTRKPVEHYTAQTRIRELESQVETLKMEATRHHHQCAVLDARCSSAEARAKIAETRLANSQREAAEAQASLLYCQECFSAAESEGLSARLTETPHIYADGSLADLVSRRLLCAVRNTNLGVIGSLKPTAPQSTIDEARNTPQPTGDNDAR